MTPKKQLTPEQKAAKLEAQRKRRAAKKLDTEFAKLVLDDVRLNELVAESVVKSATSMGGIAYSSRKVKQPFYIRMWNWIKNIL